MGIRRFISQILHKWRTAFTWRHAFSFIITATLLCLFALFFDWLIINWRLGCCEGGVCWPDIYPQCRNEHYQEFYGRGYDQR